MRLAGQDAMYVQAGRYALGGWSDVAVRALVKKIEGTSPHHVIYDLVQLIVHGMEKSADPARPGTVEAKSRFVDDMNGVLEENRSGWRICSGMIVPVMGEQDLATVREAASISEENAELVKGSLRAMGVSDPDFETSITLSAKMVENTLNKIGARGNGLGSKLDNVAGALGIPDDIFKSFKRMNDFANELARHPHDQETYRDDRNDAMLVLVWSSAMSSYLHGRWADRGRPAPDQ